MTEPVFIIAEAGVNHNGSFERALALVDVAAQAGADAVKFQTFQADLLVTGSAAKARYQVETTGGDEGQIAMLRRLELNHDQFRAIADHCRTRRIRFMSTAFDAPSLTFLAGLGVDPVKIPSGDISCAPLLLQAARLRRPTILSTGMATLADVERALGVLAFGLLSDAEPAGAAAFEKAFASDAGQAALQRHVAILHCVTEYPATPDMANLRAMDTLRHAFGLKTGYSDHTIGTAVAIAAVARGATIIEKHFTLDKSLDGPDHAASLEPDELTALVRAIRITEQALGSPLKRPLPVEQDNRAAARRSLVAARPIAAGEPFTPDALACKRPGTGVSAMDYYDRLGKPATRAYAADDLIEP